jgi:RNA polymerase sigma-32 factor
MVDTKTKLPAKKRDYNAKKADASYSGNTSLSMTLSPEQGLNRYLQEVRKFPMLERDEEFMLAKRWIEQQDSVAAEKMVTSHLRLVAKIAMGYRGYGLPIGEVISEGNVGLMQAVKKFDPDKGFRLSTYAMWWIRAAIQEYVLRSWSLVKMGTTAAQKKLFFNLRRLKGEMKAIDDGDLTPEHVTKIATKLGVKEEEVTSMNRRMGHGGDSSLNVSIGSEDGSSEWQDWLQDDTETQEEALGQDQEHNAKMELLKIAMSALNEREQDIISKRRLADKPVTLEELAIIYGVSRERIRQIEARAFEKLQEAMMNSAKSSGLIEEH